MFASIKNNIHQNQIHSHNDLFDSDNDSQQINEFGVISNYDSLNDLLEILVILIYLELHQILL